MSGFDRGLQPERTDLAWTRTALAFVVIAALVARFGRDVGVFAYVVAAELAGTGLLTAVHGRRLFATRGSGEDDMTARPRELRMVWLCTFAGTLGATAVTIAALV